MVLAPVAGAVDQTFAFTGASVHVTVPEGVCALSFELAGGNGGAADDVGAAGVIEGGTGGTIAGTMLVTPGDVMTVTVGGAGESGRRGRQRRLRRGDVPRWR